MDYESLFTTRRATPLVAGLAGVGEFGTSFLYRSRRAPGLLVPAAADPDTARIVRAACLAGYPRDRVARCESAQEALSAWERRDFVAAADASLLVELPIDVIVEATGAPESAARIADMAISRGKHVAMVSKECDSVIGPILQAKAAAAGLICTAVDGDQPSLAMGLVSWARTLGLEVVCAGKGSEYDFVFDPATTSVAVASRSMNIPQLKDLWSVPTEQLLDCVGHRAHLLSAWPQRTVPDLCEIGLIANATDLRPSTPTLHAPIARTLELPQLLRPEQEGGLLPSDGMLDMFNCLRRPDEISFAGGVFVIVRCDDPATWRVLRSKGIPTSEDLRCALLHNPVHLLGIEAYISLLSAAALGQPSAHLRPRYDLIARATARLVRGAILELGERHSLAGVEPLLVAAGPCDGDAPIPYYMAAGHPLACDVEPGEILRRRHLVPPPATAMWSLRAEQDARFFG